MPTKNGARAAHTETRQFRMHPKLLFDVINRQAGTLTKAVAEGVMNAIDAGASQVTVALSQETVIIADDGKGFRSRQEIESFFETFGEPHREGDAVYGTFRMGRGQIFSFGVNRWASGNFEMLVDIKHKGLDYELSEGTGLPAPGCIVAIALYEPLTQLGLRTIEDELRRMVRYTETAVVLNGQQISRHPGDEKWDTVTDDAYIKFGQGRLAIYNLGVFVNDHRSHSVGVGGTVVSRRQLRLNFARNDVLSDCAVWKPIAALLRARADMNIDRKKTALNEEERLLLARRVRAFDIDPSAANSAPILQDTNGHWWSISRLVRQASQYNNTISNSFRGDAKADKAMALRQAVVLNSETWEEYFGAKTIADIVLIFSQYSRWSGWWPYRHVPIATLTAHLSDAHDLLPEAEWTAHEKIVIGVCTNAWPTPFRRRFLVGRADTSDGWTDGASFIAINREFIKGMRLDSIADWTRLSLLLLHEHIHSEPSVDDRHVHGPEFYEAFHNMADTLLPPFMAYTSEWLPRVMEQHAKRADKAMLRALDHKARIQKAATKVGAIPELPVAAKVKKPARPPVNPNRRGFKF